MSSRSQSPLTMNRVMEIPPYLLENGRTLSVEKYSELFVNGYHLSQPSNFIRNNYGLCLVNTQQQDTRSVTYNHQLEPIYHENQFFEVIIELPAQILNSGKVIVIQQLDANEEKEFSGNIEDLYGAESLNESMENNDIYIRISKKEIERGKTIVIQKENILKFNTNECQKEQSRRLTNNKFTKRDYLLLKNMMEITILVPPEMFDNNQQIILRKEDAPILSASIPCRRQSKHELQMVNKENKDDQKNNQTISLEDFISKQEWNPFLSNDGQYLHLSVDFNNQSNIKHQEQIKIIFNEKNLRLETQDHQEFSLYKEILLPEITNLDQLEYTFDEQSHFLKIVIPIHLIT